MAINTKYRIKDTSGDYQVMHFETNSDQVIVSDSKQFVSQEEKKLWNAKETVEGAQEKIDSSINQLKQEVEPKIDKKSAFNKNFGNGPDSVAEGDHTHEDITLKIKNLESKLNLSVDVSSTKEALKDVTPILSVWNTTSQNVTSVTKEDGRFQFTATTAEEGLITNSLTSLLSSLTAGTEVVISCNIESQNTNVIAKMQYATGWESVKMKNVNDVIKTVKIKEGLLDFKLSVENASESTNTCVVTNLKLMIKKSLEITSNKDIPDRNYSIWSWNKTEVLNAQDTATFLQNYKINKIYQWMDMSYLSYSDIRKYVEALQEKDIKVNWLTGNSEWILKENHSEILNVIRRVSDYNKSTTNSYQRIDAIQFNMEPHTLDKWLTNEKEIIEQYQEAVLTAYEECSKLGLSLVMSVSNWFDNKLYDNKFGQGNIYDFVSKNSSYTVVMVQDVTNYSTIVREEIKINKDNRKKIAIGLETKAIGDNLTTDETFADKPIADLYNAFEILYQHLSTVSFEDKYEFAINDLASFKNYVSKFDLTIISSEARGPLSSTDNIVLESNTDLIGSHKTEIKSGNNILKIESNNSDVKNDGVSYNNYKLYHEGYKPVLSISEITNLQTVLDGKQPSGNYARKYVANIGDGSSSTIRVKHDLGTEDITILVREVATKQIVMVDMQIVDANNIDVLFYSAPAANSYRVVITG